MASITITVPDALAPRIFQAFATAYSHDPDSGVTPAQFTRNTLIAFMKEVVISVEANAAADAARAAAMEQGRTEVDF